jgi:hypothetical protein
MHKGLVSYTQTFRVADIPRDLNIVVLGAYVYTAYKFEIGNRGEAGRLILETTRFEC